MTRLTSNQLSDTLDFTSKQIILPPNLLLPNDSIVEYPNRGSFPTAGRNSRLYIALDTGLPWRWSTDSNSYALLISIIDAGEFE
jgi:hypothetical protein